MGAAVCWKGEPPSVAEAPDGDAVETDKLGVGEPLDGVNKREPLDCELVEDAAVALEPVVLGSVELLLALVKGISSKYDEPWLFVVVSVVVVKGIAVAVVVMLPDVVIDPPEIDAFVVAVYATDASLITLEGKGYPPKLHPSSREPSKLETSTPVQMVLAQSATPTRLSPCAAEPQMPFSNQYIATRHKNTTYTECQGFHN